MGTKKRAANRLISESSPYLLQHAHNPVDWYPWGPEAFEKARKEDKPIFLSIGYSACHWCHVMAHESFEDPEIAELLNKDFISVKVDKEERPDIDSIYMTVCQAFTGSGGWPTSIFMTAEQKPFFAGTYFPKTSQQGMPGLQEVLTAVHEKWTDDREPLLQVSEDLTRVLREQTDSNPVDEVQNRNKELEALLQKGFQFFKSNFDKRFGGFGPAPKFPTPHNLLFLLDYYEKYEDTEALAMVETTLLQMYCGGIFDHIGGGFCRYSTDRLFLVPHFEKMLYDNALLILAYCRAFEVTGTELYLEVAERTAAWVLREMTDSEGGFYSAQDADSEGEEGRYYVFRPREILQVLGDAEGKAFNTHFGISEKGNFEGKNIPNLLETTRISDNYKEDLAKLYKYRKDRATLHLDDKIITFWNSLMIAALCRLRRVTGNENYMIAARKAKAFIEENLSEDNTLFVSCREKIRGQKGFLDEYAAYVYALLALYDATLEKNYLNRAVILCRKAVGDFYDPENGGFFFWGKENEPLIFRPKETYDGAIPSGNSLMLYNLIRLSELTGEPDFLEIGKKQLDFLAVDAKTYPGGHGFFLSSCFPAQILLYC